MLLAAVLVNDLVVERPRSAFAGLLLLRSRVVGGRALFRIV